MTPADFIDHLTSSKLARRSAGEPPARNPPAPPMAIGAKTAPLPSMAAIHAASYAGFRARLERLLQEAGVSQLTLTMKLPPPPYAKQGGEVIAAMLAQVGVTVKIESVEWAQWLSNVYGQKDYDLTIISHVEPFDLGNFAKPDYYWNYRSPAFNALYARLLATGNEQERARLLGEAQKMVAEDAVAAYLYQPQWITVANSKLQGVQQNMPVFVNDLASLRWQQ